MPPLVRSGLLLLPALLVVWLAVKAQLVPGTAGGQVSHTQLTALDPYDTPLLSSYRSFRNALVAGDLARLMELAESARSYLAYRSALTVARSLELDPATRLRYYLLADELRVEEPLAREENRSFRLELAAVAEAAAQADVSLAAYRRALPEPLAISALGRLESDPYRLANYYLQGGLARDALDALGSLTAPSIEAPAHARMGEHDLALEAYERWLEEVPGNLEARYGVAWSHFYLGDMEAAEAAFEELPGESALYGRALIARRAGDLDRAVALMMESGTPSRLWLASGWLEAQQRYQEVIPVYLQLAQTNSDYADDAAYRALVLANRTGRVEAAARARQLIPQGSFFDLRLGGVPLLPDASQLDVVEPEVVKLAWELARVGDREAAIGELVFALREAEDEETIVAIAEALQLLGEFRQSQRAAQALVNAGSREVRTWRAAFPQAYESQVTAAAQSNGIEPELVWAVMKQESAFYPRAVSFSNAGGLMQVIPSTWNWLAELLDEEPGDRFDPEDNIRYGTFYLAWLMDYHSGDPELVIPSYNRGQGYIRRLFEAEHVAGDKDDFFREIDAHETREYLQRVTVNYQIYKALYGT